MKYFATFKDGKVHNSWKIEGDQKHPASVEGAIYEITELQHKYTWLTSLINNEVAFNQVTYDAKVAKAAAKIESKAYLTTNKPNVDNMTLPELKVAVRNILDYLEI